MLFETMILAYCGAVGFAAAGATASLFRLVTSEPPRFALLGRSWLAAVATFFFFAVTGPAILASAALRRRADGTVEVALVVSGMVIAGVWSVCSGLLVVDVALTVTDALS